MAAVEFQQGFHGCSVCHSTPQYYCNGCTQYSCSLCEPYVHQTIDHRTDLIKIEPSTNRYDWTGFHQCQKCFAKVPRSYDKCFCCSSDMLQPFTGPPLPLLTDEEVDEQIKQLALRQFDIVANMPWICESCFRYNQADVLLCTKCNRPNTVPEEMIVNRHKIIREFHDAGKPLLSRIASGIQFVPSPFVVIPQLNPNLQITTQQEFDAAVQSAYNEWPNRERASKKAFLIGLQYSSAYHSSMAVHYHQIACVKNFNAYRHAWLNRAVMEKAAMKGNCPLDYIIQENRAVLDEIIIPNDEEDPIEYFNETLSGEKNETVTLVVRCELDGEPHMEGLLTLLPDWEDLGESLIGDMQIALNCHNGNLQLSRDALTGTCKITQHSMPKFKLFKCKPCDCTACYECFARHLHKQTLKLPAKQWKCGACGKTPETTVKQKQMIASWKEFIDKPDTEVAAHTKENFNYKETQFEISLVPGTVTCLNGKCKHRWVEKDLKKNKCKCPKCEKFICRFCFDLWSKEHDDVSCLEMARTTLGTNKVIGCPTCNVYVEQVIGKCEHFDCRYCGDSFCPCGSRFYTGPECPVNVNDCHQQGFHGHHPRSCFTYLRNMLPEELEKLVSNSKLGNRLKRATCSEIVGFEDNPCGTSSYKFDLCEAHYKAYLASIIQNNKLDPLDVISEDALLLHYKNRKLDVPPRAGDENAEKYRLKLANNLKQKWALNDS